MTQPPPASSTTRRLILLFALALGVYLAVWALDLVSNGGSATHSPSFDPRLIATPEETIAEDDTAITPIETAGCPSRIYPPGDGRDDDGWLFLGTQKNVDFTLAVIGEAPLLPRLASVGVEAMERTELRPRVIDTSMEGYSITDIACVVDRLTQKLPVPVAPNLVLVGFDAAASPAEFDALHRMSRSLEEARIPCVFLAMPSPAGANGGPGPPASEWAQALDAPVVDLRVAVAAVAMTPRPDPDPDPASMPRTIAAIALHNALVAYAIRYNYVPVHTVRAELRTAASEGIGTDEAALILSVEPSADVALSAIRLFGRVSLSELVNPPLPDGFQLEIVGSAPDQALLALKTPSQIVRMALLTGESKLAYRQLGRGIVADLRSELDRSTEIETKAVLQMILDRVEARLRPENQAE